MTPTLTIWRAMLRAIRLPVSNRRLAMKDTSHRDMRLNGIRYSPADWEGRPLSDAERQQYSRAIRDLIDADLIVPVTSSDTRNRVSSFQPTATGIIVAINALEGAGETVNVQRLVDALPHTKWGCTDVLAAVRKIGGAA